MSARDGRAYAADIDPGDENDKSDKRTLEDIEAEQMREIVARAWLVVRAHEKSIKARNVGEHGSAIMERDAAIGRLGALFVGLEGHA
jgi:hypothetical protein